MWYCSHDLTDKAHGAISNMYMDEDACFCNTISSFLPVFYIMIYYFVLSWLLWDFISPYIVYHDNLGITSMDTHMHMADSYA